MDKSMKPNQEMVMEALRQASGAEQAPEAPTQDTGMQLKVNGQIMTDPKQIMEFVLANKDKFMPVDPAMAEEEEMY